MQYEFGFSLVRDYFPMPEKRGIPLASKQRVIFQIIIVAVTVRAPVMRGKGDRAPWRGAESRADILEIVGIIRVAQKNIRGAAGFLLELANPILRKAALRKENG